jgi:hypothetical protein
MGEAYAAAGWTAGEMAAACAERAAYDNVGCCAAGATAAGDDGDGGSEGFGTTFE